MRILKLRASFGKLHGTLELNEGFNSLCLPNESGKSTWSAFLVAMLYGIDTSERANTANQGLPMKERYKPWDGRAMEGSMDLEWKGRCITIERSTQRRVPMGAFRAYETASGIPVPELTGENCGKLLCGVERSVFERTAFIRQLGLAVTEDAALEKRLGAMVSTGEEGAKTYLELEKELKSRKNKLTGRAGHIAQLSARKEVAASTLSSLRQMEEDIMRLTAKKEEAVREQERAAALLVRISKARCAKRKASLTELEKKIQEQERLCGQLESRIATLPGEEQLRKLKAELENAENTFQTAKIDAALGVKEPRRPDTPQGFSGLDSIQVQKKAAQDYARCEELQNLSPRKLWLPILLSCVALSTGTGLFTLGLLSAMPKGNALFLGAGIALGIAGLVSLLLLRFLRQKAKSEQDEQLQKILLYYGLTDSAALPLIAEGYAAALEVYEKEQAASLAQKQALLTAEKEARSVLGALLEQVRKFAPDCVSVSECREALSEALHIHTQLLSQKRELENQRQTQASLLAFLGNTEAAEEDAEALLLDEAKIAYEQRDAAERLSRFSIALAEKQGAVSSIGDTVSLRAELEQLEEELAAANERSEAIDIALHALKSADDTLRSRFSPQITAEAGGLLARLTQDKYPTLLLEPDLRLSVREEADTVMRPAAAMSCGTADQMYLALRLAMCHQLLPKDAPLILDDALLSFDDTRAAAALALLEEEAKSRQVIFFTCRKLS